MIDAEMMPLTQQKTNKDVFIPVHPMWRKALDETPRRCDHILYDRVGTSYSCDGIQFRLRKLMKSIDAVGYTFHGLRKYATNYLATLGLTPHEISSMTGMSLEMVIHYTRAVKTRQLAATIAERVMGGQILKVIPDQSKSDTSLLKV